MKQTLSIIIIAGNESKNIKGAINTAKWADEIILVAANSTDMDRWKGPYRWTAVVGRTATGVPDTSTDLEFFEN